MNQRIIVVDIPKGYKVDQNSSDPTKIVLKKEVKRWEDLTQVSGVLIEESNSKISERMVAGAIKGNENLFKEDKHAKMALALAQISQLMPYYGGEITDEEWKNLSPKSSIVCRKGATRDILRVELTDSKFNYLSFHTTQQAEDFLKHNHDLVEQYYGIK